MGFGSASFFARSASSACRKDGAMATSARVVRDRLMDVVFMVWMDLKISDPLLFLLASVRNEEFLQKLAKVAKVAKVIL